MKVIKQTYLINAPVEEVWKALVDLKFIDGWGGGPAKMDGKSGTKFSLWGGEIFGENKKVIEHKLLVQDWFSKEEKREKPTKVTFNLAFQNGKTELELIHEDVPEKDEQNISDGWKDYYLGPLKDYLESKN